ncbi:MAG: hypothetical protein JOZ67_05220 [Gammaproteobacteria bacterium]|nr:hypothetical protein [Gammaproteobacteria bacterium]MBV9698100.1 hypothetical protein [Gammaproteobacteria bacterium]
MGSLFHKAAAAAPGLVCGLLVLPGARADVPTPIDGLSAGGSLSVTSDYIYRGVSESNDEPAVQGDLHLDTSHGTFLGAWASTRSQQLEPGASGILELYLGQRIDLGSSWSGTLAARSRQYLGASETSDDYQELGASLSYLDRWSVAVTFIPNAVRYWFYRRLTRSPAYVAETAAQWPLSRHLLATAGLGYYRTDGTGYGLERATGYLYGNAGLALEYGAWRLDAGYYFAQQGARRSFPYPLDRHRLAATLSWQF